MFSNEIFFLNLNLLESKHFWNQKNFFQLKKVFSTFFCDPVTSWVMSPKCDISDDVALFHCTISNISHLHQCSKFVSFWCFFCMCEMGCRGKSVAKPVVNDIEGTLYLLHFWYGSQCCNFLLVRSDCSPATGVEGEASLAEMHATLTAWTILSNPAASNFFLL